MQRRVVEAFVMLECLWANVVWARYIDRVETIAHPLGIARHVSLEWMLDGRVPWLNAALIAALLGLGFTRCWRWAYAVALAAMSFQYGARYSIGEIPHGANLIGMCLMGFALGPPLYAERRQSDRFALGFIWLAIATGYTSAALSKLIASGISWPLGEHLALWIYNKVIDSFAKSGRFELSTLQSLLVEHRWAGTLFLCAGWLTELGSGFVLWRRTRPYALTAIVGLHLGIGLVLQIWFRSATITLALLALPPSLFQWLGQRRARDADRAPAVELSRASH